MKLLFLRVQIQLSNIINIITFKAPLTIFPNLLLLSRDNNSLHFGVLQALFFHADPFLVYICVYRNK